MEKLIELLNEYEQLNMCRKFDSFEMHTFEDSNGVSSILEDTVISARYGFIKWLVENDKIDTTNRFTLMANVENKENGLGYAHTFEGYEALIMILSIQDNPIEFLISILK